MNDKVLLRKNILDIDFQKYLQIVSISVIVGFTYLIGVVIAFLTHQIRRDNFIDISILGLISVLILGFVGFFVVNSMKKIRKIRKALIVLEKNSTTAILK